jgi:capsular polysaccharide biosynthesis protein
MNLHVNFSVVLPVFSRVALELRRRYGVERISGFVYGRDSLHDLKDLGFPTEGIGALTDALRAFGDRDPDLEYLRERERRYGEPNLYAMIAGCRFVSEFPHRRALQILEVGFRLIEDLFDRYQPRAVISDGVACTLSYIQYAVARERGVPFLTIAPARINGRFYISRNHRDRYERVDALYAHYKRSGLSAAERGRAEAFIAAFRSAATKPDYFVKLATTPSFDWESLRTLARLTYRRSVLDRDNYLLSSPQRAVWNRVVRVMKARVLDRAHFEEPVPGERFVFFPLHFQPELTTLILAPYAVNQIAVIENLAKTLPIDHVLYVKEHKASLGRRPHGYYQAIQRLPNVRLLSPYLDSHDLIKASSAVCVISSTVGWEALLYEKPVITMGDVCYNSFDLVTRVHSMEEVPHAIRRATTEFQPNRDLLIKYVAAMINGTSAGDVFHVPGSPTSDSLNPANISRVADVIAAELQWAEASAVAAPVSCAPWR